MFRRAPAVVLILLCHSASAEPSAPASPASEPLANSDPSKRGAARQWFSTGVSLARAGRYAAAKALFLEAYAAEPHYLVLYNVARAELQLGELSGAVSTLRRFLSEGGAAVSPERRLAVQEQIKQIEARPALASEAAAANGGTAQLPASGTAAQVSANTGDATASVTTARQCFAAGVSLARAGRYAAAKALFLEAYAAEPHYLVLYNVARAEQQLGESSAAVSSLRRFLLEGGAAIGTERRQDVEEQIEQLEAGQALPSELAGEAIAAPQLPPRGAAAKPSVSAGAATASVTRGATPPLESEAPQSTPAPATARFWGYVLTTGGFAVVGGAIGLYMWNDERHDQWQTEDDRLSAETGPGVSRENEPGVNQRIGENNERLDSIQDFDAVPIIAAGVGFVAIGAGLWTLIESREAAQVQLASSASEFELRVRGTW